MMPRSITALSLPLHLLLFLLLFLSLQVSPLRAEVFEDSLDGSSGNPTEDSSAGSSPETERFSPEALKADFEQLRDRLYASHIAPFEARSREALDAEFRRIADRLDRPMTRADAALLFQRFVAFGNIAHARVEDAGLAFSAHVERDGAIVPFDIRLAEGAMIVADVYPGGEGLEPGNRLVAIAGQTAEALRRAMHRDLSADNDYLADALLEFEFPRILWQQIGAPERYAVIVQRGGDQVLLDLAANRPSERRSIIDEGFLWLSWSKREADLRGCETAYLRPGPFYNPEGEMWDTSAFEAFIDGAFESFIEHGAEHLLIDLRNNAGGDRSFSDYMLAWFVDRPFRFYSRFEVRNSAAARAANAARLDGDATNETSEAYRRAYAQHADGAIFDFEFPSANPRAGRRFDGEVFVLVNRHSYSNAVTTAAMVQDYGFGRILGEPTADLATTLGAMEQFKLTHTGLRVGFPKARIVRPSGQERRIGVQPDVVIETPLVETEEDPVLDRAMEHVCQTVES